MSNQGSDKQYLVAAAAVIGIPVALAAAYWVSWKSYDWLPIEVLLFGVPLRSRCSPMSMA